MSISGISSSYLTFEKHMSKTKQKINKMQMLKNSNQLNSSLLATLHQRARNGRRRNQTIHPINHNSLYKKVCNHYNNKIRKMIM